MTIIEALIQLRNDLKLWVTNNLRTKVDKEDGKGLSSCDFTTEEKNKLSGIDTGANAYTHPASHPASMITGLATVATSGSYNDLSNKPTIPAAYTLPVATSSALGGVKSGTDITIDSSGNVSINDDSHNHIISNVDGLQIALDGKAASNHTHDQYLESSDIADMATETYVDNGIDVAKQDILAALYGLNPIRTSNDSASTVNKESYISELFPAKNTSYTMSNLISQATLDQRKTAISTMFNEDAGAFYQFLAELLAEDMERPAGSTILYETINDDWWNISPTELFSVLNSFIFSSGNGWVAYYSDGWSIGAANAFTPMSTLVTILNKTENSVTCTEALIATDATMSQRYTYYLARALGLITLLDEVDVESAWTQFDALWRDGTFAYAVTINGITSLTTGINFVIVIHNNSSVVIPTLNVNGLGAVGIRRRAIDNGYEYRTASHPAWLQAGKPYRMLYDGTYWIVEG